MARMTGSMALTPRTLVARERVNGVTWCVEFHGVSPDAQAWQFAAVPAGAQHAPMLVVWSEAARAFMPDTSPEVPATLLESIEEFILFTATTPT